MLPQKHRGRRSKHYIRLAVRDLESRITPTVTAAFTGGLLAITSDNAPDNLVLSVLGSGAFALTDSGTTVALPNSPTIANVNGIAIVLGGGDDDADLSAVPGGYWTVVVNGGLGNDSILGSAGDDLLLGDDGNDTLDGSTGTDVVDGGNGSDQLRGGPGDDSLFGRVGNDALLGEAGNDLLVGHEGSDNYTGGPGDDAFDAFKDDDGAEDEVRETAITDLIATNNTLFGMGFDTFQGMDGIRLDGNVGNNVLDASACTLPVLLRGNSGNDRLLGGHGHDTLLGGNGNDTQQGGPGNDFLDGDLDNDSLSGLDGADTLSGDLGNDTLDGGAGIDQVRDRTDGNLTLKNTSLVGLGTDKLISIEQGQLEGGSTFNKFVASAFSGPVTLLGGGGNDTLIGGKGPDVLSGQGGKDALSGGPGLDTVVESSFPGNLVLTNTRLDGGAILDDKLTSIESARLTGGTVINTFDASAFTLGAVFLDGSDGNDTLIGTNKNDTLVGNQGSDTIDGKGGIDTVQETVLSSANINFTLTTGSGTSTLTGTNNFGTDTLTSVEQASLTGGDGNNDFDASGFTAGPVTLVGGAGGDILTGSPADDVLTGGADNDVLDGGAGIDTVAEFVTDFSITLSNNVLTGDNTGLGFSNPLTSIENARMTGDELGNSFFVSGWTFPATLDGGGGEDNVTSGNNLNFVLTNSKLTRSDGTAFNLVSIEGGVLIGGASDNEFDIGGFTGFISLFGGGGTADIVVVTRNTNMTLTNSSLSFSDAPGISLTGINRARLTGGAGSNRVDASAFTLGSVTLKGAGGSDTLLGGSADDTLDGGTGTDLLDGGNGTDTAIGCEIKLNIP